MDVIAHRLQVAVARAIHRQGLVAPAEQVSEEFVSSIEPRRVRAQEPLHPRHQLGPWSFHNPNESDWASDTRHEPASPSCPGLAQSGQKQSPILVILEDRLASIPTIHQVINRPRIFDSQLARHALMLPAASSVSMFRTDPSLF